ncbi:MAG: TolC family protein [Desulfomonile tiedjei]|uniref:TolC family protein n=1 Tax=Desulfomonile tiedjei TaxID=2358 RepID=A0A9D6V834_9BACT|nr:TolC family protein [Desulfomonile tiedjei]
MGHTKASNGLFIIAILGIILVLAPLRANAAEPNSKSRRDARLSLPQAVSIAISRNLRMADARLEVREKESQRREAFSDFFPTIDLSYLATGYRYQNASTIAALAGSHPGRWTIRNPESLSGISPDYPYRIDPFKSFTMAATITQPLYTGGRLLSDYKYARLGVDYSAIQFEVERQDLTLDVYDAYYQLVQGEKLLEVADSSIRALEALRNQTMEFYKAGVVPKVDVLSTEGQLAQAKIQKTQALSDIGKSKATLNFLLRYPQETPTDVVQDTAYRPNSYAIPGIYSTAAANRLEIRQANISVEQAMALVNSAKSDLLPSISVQGQASRLNDDWNPFDPEAVNNWQLQGILSWTFDMFRRRETVQERRVSQARTFVAREQLVEQVMTEVKTAYLDMRRSESDIENNRKAVEFRRENFRINQERYKEQVATYIEVLDAQRQLSVAEGDLITSLIGYKINQANLERRMGTIR